MTSLPCIGCGYDLRANFDGRCPECGADVALSRGARRLADADAGWLRRMRSGLVLLRWGATGLVWGILIFILSSLLFFTWSVWSVAGNAPRGTTPIDVYEVVAGTLGIAIAIAGLLGGVGAWIASSANPADALTETATSPRRRVRAALIAIVLISAGSTLTALLGVYTGQIALTAVGAAVAAGAWSFLPWVTEVGTADLPEGLRIGSHKVSRRFRNVALMLAVAAAARCIELVPMTWPGVVVGVVRGLGLLGLFLLFTTGASALGPLKRHQQRFRAAIEEAATPTPEVDETAI